MDFLNTGACRYFRTGTSRGHSSKLLCRLVSGALLHLPRRMIGHCEASLVRAIFGVLHALVRHIIAKRRTAVFAGNLLIARRKGFPRPGMH
ncbi:MAG: hypothetical protein WA231_22055 [Methylocella sp.]